MRIEVCRAPGFSVDVSPEVVTIEFATLASSRAMSFRIRRDGDLAAFLTLLRERLPHEAPVSWNEIVIDCDDDSYHFAYVNEAYGFTVLVEINLVASLVGNLQQLLDEKPRG